MSAQTEAPNASLFRPVRNQLGIIALLIFLIYALASIVIGFSGKIDPTQRWPLIWFLAVFPLLVLGKFGWLLSRHHGKLVTAGRESFDTEMFVSTLTADQQRRKLGADLKAFIEATATDENAANANGSITTAAPADARAIYIVAEDLVLRQIELDRGATFMRHVTLEGVPFDGVIIKDDKVIGIEVRFLTSSHIRQSTIGSLLDNAEYASTRLKRTRPNASFTFLLAVVTQMSETEQSQLKSNLVNKFGTTPVDIDIEFFDFERLQQEFAIQGLDD